MSLVFVKKIWLPLATEGKGMRGEVTRGYIPFSKNFLLANSHFFNSKIHTWTHRPHHTLSPLSLSLSGDKEGSVSTTLETRKVHK